MLSRNKLIFTSITVFSVCLLANCSDNSIDLGDGEPREPRPVEILWQDFSPGDTVDTYLHSDSLIYCSNIELQDGEITEADTSSFEVWPESNYARDSSYVYYPIQSECFPTDSIEVCFCTEYIVDNANPSGFRYLGNGYGTDGNELYLFGEIVEGNQGEGF